MVTTPEEVWSLSYVDFISLLRETNRCPGGKATIREILQNSFVDRDSRVLEIGANTGFTSLEIARTAGCRVTGIDVAARAIRVARQALARDCKAIQARVEFLVGSAYDLPFQDASFDVVVAGGASSFMDDRQRAISEYYRVLAPWGFLSTTHLCYKEPPARSVLDRVSEIIGIEIQPWGASEWLELLERSAPFEQYYTRFEFLGAQPGQRIREHVDYFMGKAHLAELSPDVRKAIRERWHDTLRVFNENHRTLGYVLAVHRKRMLPEEPELFVRARSNGRP